METRNSFAVRCHDERGTAAVPALAKPPVRMPYRIDEWRRDVFKNGPEYQFGWRERRSDDGSIVEVFARHHKQNRIPNSGELSRLISRGQPFQLVERVTHEWVVLRDGRNMGALRENPNGTFSVGSFYTSRDREGIMDAAVAAARRIAGPPRPVRQEAPPVDEEPDSETATPGPR